MTAMVDHLNFKECAYALATVARFNEVDISSEQQSHNEHGLVPAS